MDWKTLLCADRIRTYQHPDTREIRTEFERDYHRIIDSASFRRLQDKTQVFPLDESDFVRTRLTHSLEVSSIARSLGSNVSQKIMSNLKDPDFEPEYVSDICNILQCAGLIHDIGNPPFGHFGETTIREWFQKNLPDLISGGAPVESLLTEEMKNDFYHFEGNAQGFRLVTKLHYLVDSHGMNLTKALLATIIKYPVSSVEISKESGDIRRKKMGYFLADKKDFDDVQSSCGTNGRRHPLAFLLEAADDIAYITADIEDAYKKRYLSFDLLQRELTAYGNDNNLFTDESSRYKELMDSLQRKFKRGMDQGNADPGEYAVQNWVITVQVAAINEVTDAFIRNYDAIMEGTYKKELIADSNVKGIMQALGRIELKYVFQSSPIYKHEIAEEVILDFLLDKFVPAAAKYDTDEPMTAVETRLMGIISENYMSVYKTHSEGKNPTERLYLRLMLATDYICGMTDTFAKTLYQDLSGNN